MAKLEFAVFDNFASNFFRSVPEAVDVYERSFREVQLEEQLGFDYHFVVEHQGHVVGQCQSPPVYLAALAQRTSTIRIGGMIFLIPFYNPMRLAQDVAMVDQLSRGRMEFGVGIGPREHEFLRWNLPFAERRAMGMEALEIIEKAWTKETVTHDGKFWQFDEAIPLPKPYQKPHPPIWWGGHSQASLEYAAAKNYNIGLFLERDATLAEMVSMWRRLWKDAGHQGPMPRSFLARSVYVAETDEQAREEVEPYLVQFYTYGIDVLERTRFGMQRGDHGSLYRKRGSKIFDDMATGIDFWLENDLALVGSPETIIRRLEKSQQLVGFDLFGSDFRSGPMPDEMVEKSMTLFAKEVMPAFS